MSRILNRLEPGMEIIYGGNKVVAVPPGLADAFRPGDRLIVLQDGGDLLHIPSQDWDIAVEAVDAAAQAFSAMGDVGDGQVAAFYEGFAARLEEEATFGPIAAANEDDLASAKERGRSTTRLVLSEEMRRGMIEGLRMWAKTEAGRGEVVGTVTHPGWTLDLVRFGLGVVGFVFEGRPNVLADACGVLRSGNTTVLRIGSDALGTGRAIVEHALRPALGESGLPTGAVSLLDSPSRAAGWAMFSDPRLGLAVARGSGRAVAQLGAVARQAGIPASLHGTGGAWIVAADSADPKAFSPAVYHSLDRKVCNTLNTACIVSSRAEDLIPVFLDALDRAGKRREAVSKLHVTEATRPFVPPAWFEEVVISRAQGPSTEPRTEVIGDDRLGEEWEWENSPEVTLALVDDVDTAVELFNQQSPRFAASLISDDPGEHERFFSRIDAPFVGNGFTRWVDGQYALDKPELGLSNWQHGRLLARGAILSGDSVFTIRARARQDDPGVSR